MTTFFATVTFDLQNADSDDYQDAQTNLAAIGLHKAVTADDGRSVDLPYNTFAGKFNGSTAAGVRDYIRDHAKAALNKSHLSGRLFVAVGGDWGWGSTIL